MDQRLDDHARLSAALAAMGDDELAALVHDGPPTGGWGQSRTIEIDGSKVFAKSVPLTDREREHAGSTRNLYRLPTYYSYGVGSAGFGVWRELAMHVRTTAWVLDGACAGFPLMYHHRVLPRPPGGRFEGERLEGYVRYWNGSRAIGRFMSDRAVAPSAVVMFLEHIPFTAGDWLADKLERTEGIARQVFDTVGFLREQGVVHFDAHFGNVVTDGETAYLTDFGLALDPTFELTKIERAFLARHDHYDYGEVVWSIAHQLIWWHHELSEDEQRALGLPEGAATHDICRMLVDRVEDLGFDDRYVDSVLRHREPILYMNEVFRKLRAGSRKVAPYDDATLRDLLRECSVL